MTYEQLKTAQQRAFLTAEIARFEGEHYRHALARETAEKLGDEEAVLTAVESMRILSVAIGVRQDASKKLPKEKPPKAESPPKRGKDPREEALGKRKRKAST